MGMANKGLDQFERELTPEGQETGRTGQRPRTEPNVTAKNKKVNERIPDDILLYSDWCLAQLSSERPHPATDGNRCRDPQPNTRQGLGNPVEDREGGFEEPEGSRTP